MSCYYSHKGDRGERKTESIVIKRIGGVERVSRADRKCYFIQIELCCIVCEKRELVSFCGEAGGTVQKGKITNLDWH